MQLTGLYLPLNASSRKYYYYRETYRRPIKDPSETDMSHRRPIRDRHVSSETHRRPTCLMGDILCKKIMCLNLNFECKNLCNSIEIK